MTLKKTSVIRLGFLVCTSVCGIASLAIIAASYDAMPSMQAWLLPKSSQKNQVWISIREDDIRSGTTIPADSNVMIYLPEEITSITRKTLFGRTGSDVRYWGFCFPQTAEEAEALRRRGIPGTIFLSEKEREIREAQYLEKLRNTMTIYDDRDTKSIQKRIRESYGNIRHQQEIFTGGMVCYVMTESIIPIGTDEDGDGANIKVEIDHNSNPKQADTDGDGISDGLEIFYLGTSPIFRDTDGDGLIDGIEDKNRNGRVDIGESDPTKWDTDGDGLCDGLCFKTVGVRTGYSAPVDYEFETSNVISGEDMNLNGELDDGETDPTKIDTDGDGILDDQEFYNCQLSDGEDC